MNVDRLKAKTDEKLHNNLMVGQSASHIITDYQKIDRLLHLESLIGRKPPDLLVDMEKLKPANKKQYSISGPDREFFVPDLDPDPELKVLDPIPSPDLEIEITRAENREN
jgi:hypothetical protein